MSIPSLRYSMDITSLVNILPSSIIKEIPSVITTFQINTPLRLSHFLGQCAHESGNFQFTRENLNYSANGLLKTFPRHFTTLEDATKYARQPERIANKIYANRIGNGPESSGDGWKFRGRGFIQLTGRANYMAFDSMVQENLIDLPDLVATKYPLLSAAWFWNTRRLNSIADTGSDDAVIHTITRRVNGGLHGLSDRIIKFTKYYSVLETS